MRVWASAGVVLKINGARAWRSLVVLLGTVALLAMAAGPAWALQFTMSPSNGDPGTTVTLNVSDLKAPCEVSFDSTVVVATSACAPSDGKAVVSFKVPSGTANGPHQVSVKASSSDSSEQSSLSFRVGPLPSPSPSPKPSPSPSPSALVSPRPSPAAKPSAQPSPSLKPKPVPSASAASVPSPSTVTPQATASPPATPATLPGCPSGAAMVESFTVSPRSGPAGTTPEVVIKWAARDSACPADAAQLTFDGQVVGASIPVGGSPAQVFLTVAKGSKEGAHSVELVDLTGNVLSSASFEVKAGSSGSRALLLAAATVALAATASLIVLGVRRVRAGR
jgi:hypothetical protein